VRGAVPFRLSDIATRPGLSFHLRPHADSEGIYRSGHDDREKNAGVQLGTRCCRQLQDDVSIHRGHGGAVESQPVL